ncbi:MAG: ABC transporter ATP-binding protein [Actinobacteria bacterium RBG_16_64_13]|nr:MAG: ABC transporter ATP-binding protein [Actinobacteria bacterium RBG_16_64_13]
MLLEVTDLVCKYKSAVALKGVSCKVGEGEVVALVGANGAGKTTLLRALSGLMNPAAGHISFSGQRIDGHRPHEIVKLGMAHVPEGRMVIATMSVLDNIKMGAYLRKDSRQVQTDIDKMYEYFPVLKERRNQSAGSLSGGEQQMLAVARALMSSPRLVLMDEPSMGLSPKLVETVRDIVVSMHERGLGILLVEQNAVMALSVADRAYVLEVGKVVLEGEAQAIAQDEGVRRAYLGG